MQSFDNARANLKCTRTNHEAGLARPLDVPTPGPAAAAPVAIHPTPVHTREPSRCFSPFSLLQEKRAKSRRRRVPATIPPAPSLSGDRDGIGEVKASRPLIRVLVINDNDLWINNFIRDNEHRLIERASRPLVGFGVLIDNTIKGLTCLHEIMSRYLIK